MEHITSRKNRIITHLRSLGSERAYRRSCGEYLCDGETLLQEALSFGAEIVTVLCGGELHCSLPETTRVYSAPQELIEYVSPLKNSRGPLFSVRIPNVAEGKISNAIVLENVQDPGNVGTVIRTASAFGIDAVILVGDCADAYNFKTVRSAMGALFRQKILSADLAGLCELLGNNDLKLYGAALTDRAEDIRNVDVRNAAVAIGSEGQGLSKAFLERCDGQTIIPMMPHSESLNAAVAASVVMWEMNGGELPCLR